MSKKPKTSTVHEALALLDYLLAESYAHGKDMHYRLKVPYGDIDETDEMRPVAELVVEVHVYYDGELTSDERATKFKITGPSKNRH
jgi:hypothetical protein